MVTIDLHYHTNIFGCSRHTREARLRLHRLHLDRTGVDCVAATEHGYKKPLDAYLALRDATAELPIHIIAGVEAVSAEGVDIIFLFDSEAALVRGLKELNSFEWRLWDTPRIARHVGAVTIIPHPCTPGRSGVVNAAGEEGLLALSPQCDYVEVHNGSSLLLLKTLARGSKRRYTQELTRRIDQTFDLPHRLRAGAHGWAVGSDAHYPGHQQIVGRLSEVDRPADAAGWHELLRQRHRFEFHLTSRFGHGMGINNYQELIRSAKCVLGEAVQKRLVKGRQQLVEAWQRKSA